MRQQFEQTTKQQELVDCVQPSVFIQPALTLPARYGVSPSTFLSQPGFEQEGRGLIRSFDAVEDTVILPTFFPVDAEPVTEELVPTGEPGADKGSLSPKKKLLRGIALVLCLGLALVLYVSWRALAGGNAPVPVIASQSYSSTPVSQSAIDNSSSNAPASVKDSGTIQVYILGAVKHPGVYVLASGARVYELVQKAGGLLPHANMVALNLAAKLVDGEEIYVQSIGETPPPAIDTTSNTGTPGSSTGSSAQPAAVDINTATSDELRQELHVSAATAQKIIDYRTQHGSYTAVSQLLQAVSQSIYDRIKDLVTI